MTASAGLSRWLPTMFGAMIAVGVAMAYELDWIDDDAPRDCPQSQPEAAPAPERPRNPVFAGARPRPVHDSAQSEPETDPAALADRLAMLETQAALLAERNVTGELSYYGLGQAELEAMARHCDVRTDYPTRLDPQQLEDLGLEPAEREAYERALANFSAQELELYRELLRDVAPDTPGLDELSLAEIRKQLTRDARRHRAEGDDALQRHVAEERAGLREAPADPASLSPWNRYNRLRFNAGDRFAELLGDELGEARAHELRSVFDGWPGARTRQVGCPGESINPRR